jgi:hypothetical protein
MQVPTTKKRRVFRKSKLNYGKRMLMVATIFNVNRANTRISDGRVGVLASSAIEIIQRSPVDCGLSEWECESSIMRRP